MRVKKQKNESSHSCLKLAQVGSSFASAYAMPVLDYKQVDLFKNGRKVDHLRVTGLLAEDALAISQQIGISALSTAHLPSQLSFSLDRRGRQLVCTFPEDRALAVKLAVEIRFRLKDEGFGVLRAVPQEEGRHDLVLEVNTRAALGQFKLISCELRCRHLYSQAGERTVREALREECVDQCSWWQKCQASGNFSGRLLLLAVFATPTATEFKLRAEYVPVGGSPRGVFGWPGSRPIWQSTPPPLPVSRPTPTVRSHAVPPPTGPQPARRPKTWDDVRHKLTFRSHCGRQVAPVAVCLKASCKDSNHIGRDMGKWQQTIQKGHVYQIPRRGQHGKNGKKGGSEEWVATVPFLKALFAEG